MARELWDYAAEKGIHMSLLDIGMEHSSSPGGGFPGNDGVDVKFSDIADAVNAAIETYFPNEKDVKFIVFAPLIPRLSQVALW